MINTTVSNVTKWIQAIGLGLLALIIVFTVSPIKSHAWIFNSDGNDGYFLSLTNDPTNIRVVPTVVYDSHPHKQKATAFIEWGGVEVNYTYPSFNYNNKSLPSVGSGEDGKDDFADWAQDETEDLEKHGMLAWTFPGFSGVDDAEDYQANQSDMDRALWVSDNLVQDFNSAITFVHSAVQEYGDKSLSVMSDNQFANMINQIANAGRNAQNGKKATFKYHGVSFNVTKASMKGKRIPSGIQKDAYVTITVVDHEDVKGTFIEYVQKGYRKGQPLYNGLPADFQKKVEESGNKDQANLNWMTIALQSNSFWAAGDVTFTNVSDINEAGKLEQSIADMGANVLTGLRQMLGMYSSTDLIMNNGTRGTDSYYNGIMPKTWMSSADVLHWISYAVAWMLIIGSIVKLLVQRNVAAINPSQRVDMINGIKNLMIVGFALSIYDVVFAGITEFNYLIVDMLANSGTPVSTFGTAPISAGVLTSIIIGLVFFCLDVYFNFFYISRALMIAILYAVGPLYVASIAYGEKYRQIFSNYAKELVGNVFVQSFQAILVVFFVGITVSGNIRTIETMVLLFCFIPMTKFFKESIGASGSTAEALTGNTLGAGAGLAAGLVGSQFAKGKGGGKGGKSTGGNVEGGSDIKTKSGNSFGSNGGGKGGVVKSMAGVGLKAVGGAAKATVGAGLVAGGAATGMRGASQIGGFMVGSGLDNLSDAGKATAGGAMNIAKSGANKMVNSAGKIANRHNISGDTQGPGSPMPEQVQTLSDGSSMQTFNKSNYSDETGITSMKDLDNIGNEMEVGTNLVPGQGFINGKKLNGSQYERNMMEMANAFKNNDVAKMNKYREQGIMGMNIDKSGRASFIVNKDRAGIGEVSSSGDNLHIQRKHSTAPGPNDKYAQGTANPFTYIG